jgi:pimeloyl-ACP methyl ester carboxylesterase
MPKRRKARRKIIRTILPITILLIGTILSTMIWVIYGITHVEHHSYLVTPDRFVRLSSRGTRVSDETWKNRDGTPAQGWLLKGTEGAPAILMLHKYGADRSWLLNLGVKLNEATNFTILWMDLRGHGEKPLVSWTGLGTYEVEDTLAALDFLHSLKTSQGKKLVGNRIGIYGVELGASIALEAASRNPQIRVLVVDSIPGSSDELLDIAINKRIGINNGLIGSLAESGLKIYFGGKYKNSNTCSSASFLTNQKLLLLTGDDAGQLKDSTIKLVQCLPSTVQAEVLVNLPLSGLNIVSATGEQGEIYDRRVIDFFDRNLSSNEQP